MLSFLDGCWSDSGCFSTLAVIITIKVELMRRKKYHLRLLPVPSELDFDSDVSIGKSRVFKVSEK